MTSPRKMATRESGKMPKNSEIARSFWIKSDRFWRNYQILPKSLKF